MLGKLLSTELPSLGPISVSSVLATVDTCHHVFHTCICCFIMWKEYFRATHFFELFWLHSLELDV